MNATPAAATRTVDSFTFEIIRQLLIAALDDAEVNLARTAFSPFIYEVKDYCIGLLDARGRVIAQSQGSIPTFIADLDEPIRDGLEIWGEEGLEPGDVLLMNYAEVCGQHLNNMVVYAPIHWEGRLIGFAASRAHWTDVGGQVPGSVSTNTTDIFQEGLQLRSIKVHKRGRADEEILRILRHNTRFPDLTLGDMAAQIEAGEMVRSRWLAMIEKYGWETIDACVEMIWDQSESFVRDQIRALPDGEYFGDAFCDDDGITFDRTLPIKVRVEIAGDEMTIDFTGTCEQTAGPMNTGRSGGLSAAKVAFKSVITPRLPSNEGAFRALKVVLPEGTLISATNNAALSLWTVTMKTVIETVYLALSQAVPDRIPAAHHSAMGAYTFYGRDERNGSLFKTLDSVLGGWGARPNSDGFSPLKTVTHGDTRNVPIEIEETSYPLTVERYEWRPDTAGAGRFRGGLGLRKVYALPQSCHLMAAFDRSKCPPWGLFGGQPAKVGGVVVYPPDGGDPRSFQKVTGLLLERETRAEFLSAGGGGRGDPFERDPGRVLEDVRQGYVTFEGARRDYGVVIDEVSLTIDEEATARMRARPAQGAGAESAGAMSR